MKDLRFKILLLFIATVSVIAVLIVSNSNRHVRLENDEIEAFEHQMREAEGEEFEDLISNVNKELIKNVGTANAVTEYVPGVSECYAEGMIAGYWDRATCKLEDASHGDGVPNVGPRTKKSIYDPIHNSLYILSMSGEVFYADKLQKYNGVVPTNPKVLVDDLSFGGVYTPDSTFRLFGGIIGGAPVTEMHFSDDKGKTWEKSVNGYFSTMYWATPTDSNEIIVVCKDPRGIVIKRSVDFGASYQDIQTITSDYGIVKTTRVLNTPDRFEILVQKNSSKRYRRFVYENKKLTAESELPNLMFDQDDAKRLYSVKIGDEITYSFVLKGSGFPVIIDGKPATSDFMLRIYDKNWVKIDSIIEDSNNPGTIFPLDNKIILSRWTTPRYYDRSGSRSWVKLLAESIGYDIHDIQFFKTRDDKWLMINNSDIGVRYKEISNLNDLTDPASKFERLDVNHYYADLHGGDAHSNGLIVGSYQDQGTELLVKLNNGTYEARKLTGSDGLEAQINTTGNAAWYRHYWQTVYYRKFDNGIPGKTYTINVDLGKTWYTPRMTLTQVPGEEAIYMGGKSKIIKIKLNTSTNKLDVSEMSYAFPAVVSTVVVAEGNPDRMYVSTKGGRFYYSTNRGISWIESISTILTPFKASNQNWGGSTGEVIEVAKNNPNIVYFSNNHSTDRGYHCMLSTDGGRTFNSISKGLENAGRVRDISISDDGEMAFSSTYYVYFRSKNRWYPLIGNNFVIGGVNAKNVVYLKELGLVRFFTYAAGVIDFVIDDKAECLTSSVDQHRYCAEKSIKLFPNPSSDMLRIEWTNAVKPLSITIFNSEGKMVKNFPTVTENIIKVSDLPNGTYTLSMETLDSQYLTKRFAVMR
jgi:hypothetical protein